MDNRLIGWAIWFTLLILSAFTVPFLFLSGQANINGAFAFWGLFAVTAIANVIYIISNWRD